MENAEFVNHRLDDSDISTLSGLFEYLSFKTGDMYRCYRILHDYDRCRYFIALVSGEKPNPKCEIYIPTKFSFRPYGSWMYDTETVKGLTKLYCLIEITEEQYHRLNEPTIRLDFVKDRLCDTTPVNRDGKMFYISSTAISDIKMVNKKFEHSYIYRKLNTIIRNINSNTNKTEIETSNYKNSDIEDLKNIINTEIKSINDKLDKILKIAERYDLTAPIPCDCTPNFVDISKIAPITSCDTIGELISTESYGSVSGTLNVEPPEADSNLDESFPTGLFEFRNEVK